MIIQGYAPSDSGSAEQRHTARAFHAVAVCCNVATVVYYIMALIALVVTLGTILEFKLAILMMKVDATIPSLVVMMLMECTAAKRCASERTKP
jgi:hypothetical protein